MSFFTRYDAPPVGFRTVAGRAEDLTAFVIAAGRLPADDHGPVHLHHGDEVLRVLDGEVEIDVGGEVRVCSAGDVAVVPADTLHSFRTLSEVRIEVVAALDAGQLFPVRDGEGPARLVEVYRPDLPWGRTPPPGFGWTTDEEMAEILRRVP